jgi:hypothetical protein
VLFSKPFTLPFLKNFLLCGCGGGFGFGFGFGWGVFVFMEATKFLFLTE